jgi:retinol-binding protein 3
MSEQIYALLLRIFIPRFQRMHGEEAIQLFRDRSRDEQGFTAKLRLWLDLLADLAVSVTRDHQFAHRQLMGGIAARHLDGMLSFSVVKSQPPCAVALLLGGLVSVITLGTLPLLISHGGHGPASGQTAGFDLFFANRSGSHFQTPVADEYNSSKQAPNNRSSGASLVTVPSFNLHSARTSARFDDAAIDATERKNVIKGVIAKLQEYYVYPDVARKMVDALTAHENADDYKGETDGRTFAELLTNQLQDVSRDRHLRVFYHVAETHDHPSMPPDDDANFRKMVERDNCSFHKAEVLPHNIGYLKFDAFPPVGPCRATVAAAMGFLAHVDAIIFDLRDNHGGDPHMVALIASYLFDRPTHLNDIYNRRENSTQEFWTVANVPGPTFSAKPAYVLTSPGTFSGAEEFTYDLKNLKRATIVGEATGGGAHLVMPRRIDDHFEIGVPFARAVNPISKTDWEGRGVAPDVKVKASDALEAAEGLAESKLEPK